MAVKIDGGADVSDEGALAAAPGWEPGPRSGANSRVKSKTPLSPVRSTTVRSTDWPKNCASTSIVILLPLSRRSPPRELMKNPPQKDGIASPGLGGGGGPAAGSVHFASSECAVSCGPV